MTNEPRTAAATAAWRRRAEERKAGELRARGWLVVAPEDSASWARRQADMVATVRDTQLPADRRVALRAKSHATDVEPWVLVDVRDAGAGGQLVATWTSPGRVPAAAQIGALADLGHLLSAQGWAVRGGWTVGTDAGGRYASAPVDRPATDSHSVSEQGR